MWEAFAKIILDSATSNLSSKPLRQSSVEYDARILSWGRIDRSVPAHAGIPQIADAEIFISDVDVVMRQLLIEQTFQRRTVEIRFVDSGGSPITQTKPIFSGEIIAIDSDVGRLRLTITDRLFSWLDEEIPALLTADTFPEYGVTIFAPIWNGINSRPKGIYEPVRVPGTSRWVLACHAVFGVEVFRLNPDNQDFELVNPAEYVTPIVQRPASFGLLIDFQFLDFLTDQPDDLEIRVNIQGIFFRGTWGALPATASTAVLRNPIDFFINMVFFFLRKHGLPETSQLFATESIAALRAQVDGVLLCDTGIVDTITARDFLSRFLISFELVMFQRQIGDESGLLDLGVLTISDPAPLAVGENLIMDFKETVGRRSFNEVVYRFDMEYLTGAWGSESEAPNADEQSLIGADFGSPVVRYPKAEREYVEMHYVRDSSSALSAIQRRMVFYSVSSYRQTFSLPLPEVFPIELTESLAVSHIHGLQFGGYRSREVKILRTTYDLDQYLALVETVVLAPQVPRVIGTADIVRVWFDVGGVSPDKQRHRVSFTEGVDGDRYHFTWTETPVENTERIFINGILQLPGIDYAMTGNQVDFAFPPQVGDVVETFYDIPNTTGFASRAWIVPTGTVNGTNADFELPEAPEDDSERVYVGVMMMVRGLDYEMSTPTTIHFLTGVPQIRYDFSSPPVEVSRDKIYVFYDVVGTRKARRFRVTPAGPVNGINPLFVLLETPLAGSEEIFVNAILQFPTADYSLQTSRYSRVFYSPEAVEIKFTAAPTKT